MNIERLTTNGAFRAFGADELATYSYGAGGSVPNVRAVLDRDIEIYDEDQLPLRVTTISVPVKAVPKSQRGDSIVMDGRTWHVNRILDDDGYHRVIEVT